MTAIVTTLDCSALWGTHSDDRVTVHAGSAPLLMCGRHASTLDADDLAAMRAPARPAWADDRYRWNGHAWVLDVMSAAPAADVSFSVHCGYCQGVHAAALDVAPYGGTVNGGYGVLYGVHCTATNTRYGVHTSTTSRIR